MTLKSNLFKIIFVLIFIFIFGSLNFSVYAASSSSSEVASDFNNYVNKDKFFYLANENEKYDYIISEYIDFCEKNNIACNEEDYNTVYENFYCSLFDLDLEEINHVQQDCLIG